METVEPAPLGEDPVLMIQVLARAVAAAMMHDLRDELGEAVRESDGYVFQHLAPGPLSIGQLAERLGITQQGASKAIGDMERRGLVLRVADGSDRRIKRVELSPTARRAMHIARTSRAELAQRFDEELGTRRSATLRRMLADLVGALGVDQVVAQREVQAPD